MFESFLYLKRLFLQHLSCDRPIILVEPFIRSLQDLSEMVDSAEDLVKIGLQLSEEERL